MQLIKRQYATNICQNYISCHLEIVYKTYRLPLNNLSEKTVQLQYLKLSHESAVDLYLETPSVKVRNSKRVKRVLHCKMVGV
jgi:hypothetical protein